MSWKVIHDLFGTWKARKTRLEVASRSSTYWKPHLKINKTFQTRKILNKLKTYLVSESEKDLGKLLPAFPVNSETFQAGFTRLTSQDKHFLNSNFPTNSLEITTFLFWNEDFTRFSALVKLLTAKNVFFRFQKGRV